MIDWTGATGYLAELITRGETTWKVVDDVLRHAPPFRNKDYPLSPLPVLLKHTAAAEHAETARQYVRLLDKAVGLYLGDERIRRWYGLTRDEDSLIRADRRLGGQVAVCRLDGYLEQGSERVVLLENNADAPAGTLFTARINRLVFRVLDHLGVRTGEPGPLTCTDEAALVTTLRECAARGGLAEPQHVAILQAAGSASIECTETARVFVREGIDAYVADPRDLRVTHGRVSFAGRPADACWNKVNTATWRSLLTGDPDVTRRWTEAVGEVGFLHVNPFGARYVAENKLTLALPQEPEFAELFDEAERALAAGLLPWSRKLADGVLAPDGATPLGDDLLERQCDYVVKQPYDIRGDGVTIGRAVDRSTWRVAVRRAWSGGHLVQSYVAPTAYPTVRDSAPPVVVMPMSMDTYVMNGRVRGFGSKASRHARVNVFQGGQKLAVHVLPDTAAADAG
jgi:hypothetical protein